MIQGWREPSFFYTKKKAAPRGNEDGQISPAASDSPTYLSMLSCSGPDQVLGCTDGWRMGGPRKHVDDTVVGSMRG